MRRSPSQHKHREWIAGLMRFGARHGLRLALLLGAGIAVLVWQGLSHTPTLIVAPLAGALSFHQGWQYHHGGDESHWLMMILFAFSGWPILQLMEKGAITQLEQGALTLQYFALVSAVWMLLAALAERKTGLR